MKRKLTILILAAVAALCCLLAACSTGVDIDEIKREYPICVVFDYNGGKEGEADTKTVYCKSGSLLLEPGGDSLYPAPVRAGYTVSGYWRGTKDEEGNVTLLSEWDFDNDRVTEDMTLFAAWEQKKTITVYYGYDFENSYVLTVVENTAVQNWSVFTRSDMFTVMSKKWSGHSLTGFYFDADCTEKVEFPYDYKERPVEALYAQFIDGTWTVVESASDLVSVTATSNIYLLCDVDLSTNTNNNLFGATRTTTTPYSGEFNGNGYKITGYSFTRTTSTTVSVAGLFGKIGSTAYIHDLTLENFALTVNFNELKNNAGGTDYIGLLAGEISDGARIEDVALSGTVSYDDTSSTLYRSVVCNGAYGNYTGESFAEDFPTFAATITVNPADLQTLTAYAAAYDKSKKNTQRGTL